MSVCPRCSEGYGPGTSVPILQERTLSLRDSQSSQALALPSPADIAFCPQ